MAANEQNKSGFGHVCNIGTEEAVSVSGRSHHSSYECGSRSQPPHQSDGCSGQCTATSLVGKPPVGGPTSRAVLTQVTLTEMRIACVFPMGRRL